MEFLKKIKIRFYTALMFVVIGLILIAIGILKAVEMASSFGLMFLVIGITRIIQYNRLVKNETTFHKREVAENDERNIMLWTKARSLTFSVYIMIAALSIVILYIMNIQPAARIVTYSLFLFMFIYWVCYFIISRKY